MYTDKVEDLEKRKMEKKMDAAQKKGQSRMGINPAKIPVIKTQKKREKNIRRSPCSLCHG